MEEAETHSPDTLQLFIIRRIDESELFEDPLLELPTSTTTTIECETTPGEADFGAPSELYEDIDEEGDLMEDMQMNFLELKVEKEEGLSLGDFGDAKDLDEMISDQRFEGELRVFLLERRYWQNGIEGLRKKIRHLGIWEDVGTRRAAPHCVGADCNSRFSLKRLTEQRSKVSLILCIYC